MDDLLARVRAEPCGARLLAAAAGLPAHLVGGAVRDLLLGRPPRELDVAVEGPVAELALSLGGAAVEHERFGTATVLGDGCRFDLARTRAERYPHPGALPEVRPAGIDEDLGRRDLTVNALALDLRDGRLRSAPGALEDLAAGRLRVLHDASFLDDPTRLWRIARYAARLGFELNEDTQRLADEAVLAGALRTISGERAGGELRLALTEPDPVAALARVSRLGLTPWPAPDRPCVDRALDLLPAGEGRADLVVLACAMLGAGVEDPDAAVAHVAGLGFGAAEQRVLRAALRAPQLAERAKAAARPSVLAEALRPEPVEAVALAGAVPLADEPGATRSAEQAVLRWLDELRHVRLAIDGDDLRAAGIPEGPAIGRALSRVLDRRLDGELTPGAATELRAALDA